MTATLLLPDLGSAYRLTEDRTDVLVTALTTTGQPDDQAWTLVDWRGLDPALDERVANIAYALRLI